MSKRKKRALIILISIIAILVAYVIYRRCTNYFVSKNARSEFESWLSKQDKLSPDKNGAQIINKGIALLGDFHYWTIELDFDNQASVVEVTGYVEKFQNAMQLVKAGLKYKEWSFSPDLEKGFMLTLPSFYNLRQAEILFTWKGQLQELKTQYSKAMLEYISILKLANTLNRNQTVISRLFQRIIQIRGLASLRKMLSDKTLSKTDLIVLKKTLLNLYSNRTSYLAVLDTEFHLFLESIARLASGDECAGVEPWYNPWIYDFGDDVDYVRSWINEVSELDPCKFYEWPEHIKKREMEDDFQLIAKMGFFSWLGWELFSSEAYPIKGFLKSYLESELEWRGVLTLLAIRLFEFEQNQLPDKLVNIKDKDFRGIIIDPCSGKELIYRKESNDFYLYGVGKNGIDDNCKASTPFDAEHDAFDADLDFIFHTPSKN
ncbi:MAG: hypothetical protein E3J72_20435 [Planctomycetota bacterium]|nr:MAG: hypothetical protein E3J72_20435 [Planctomycetota bacterium]